MTDSYMNFTPSSESISNGKTKINMIQNNTFDLMRPKLSSEDRVNDHWDNLTASARLCQYRYKASPMKKRSTYFGLNFF
jgi:hypothetical protein